ncbi:MAG: GNAT family N-acetyltransferase [Candidatus Thorarchaeota archaeon]|nr:MAG: GNAT family N-acetyltransferase [Candidatus Thorarchaeota archaeon]
MPEHLRELVIEDHDQVKLLCENIWEGNDYVPEEFPMWISNSTDTPVGIFKGDELVALADLQKIDGTVIGWLKGLRVKEGHRQKGYGVKVTKALTAAAKEQGIRILWYATSSQNEASRHVAERSGFSLADSTGYFRLYRPYPEHSSPSPTLVPLQIDANRLHEILLANPELVESTTFPLAWQFDFKSVEGLSRLLKDSEIKVIIDEEGLAQGLYCLAKRDRKEDIWTAAYTVFATNRSVFVDVISRTIDEADVLGAERAVYFLGPRATEWALTLGYVDEEFIGRRFLLYELNLSAE